MIACLFNVTGLQNRIRMKIKRLLIANRGEIAIRIIQSCKKMGIKSCVLKTSREPSAYYLQEAEEVIDISDNQNDITEFLDVERLVEIAKENKIDAVHPGYGFLSENPYFAQRCKDEGIIFVGPSPDSIYKMGNKTIAKQIARKHNVPLLEGSNGNINDVKEVVKIAKKIGYPVILKAASGGGGRGMRIVEKEEDIEKAFRTASNEAEKAFNDPSVFVEKYIRNPRHIEFQILADNFGNVIHLGERECSIQRKHQKLIEEAPSSALDEELRAKMGEASINMAKAVSYSSVGTVEFLLDDEKNFYFMEMNTRIQVEHPVTEEITGVDLIEQQIKMAQNEKLSLKQEDIVLHGWAIECRINAEDVQAGFSPNMGKIDKIVFPKGKNIRIETGIKDTAQITPDFDSMIAKLIVKGDTRTKAISNTIAALKKIKIKGLKTTIPFCKAVMHNNSFKKGEFNTSFITTELDKTYYKEPFEEALAAFFATNHYINDIISQEETSVDYESGKKLAPWLLNKRLKSI